MKIANSFVVTAILVGALATTLPCVAADMESKPASPATIAAQAKVLANLPPDDGQDEEFARRGFIATPNESKIYNKDGKLVWDIGQLDWIKGRAPASINPSLWRQDKLLAIHGLFKVTDGVWQVRGIDGANLLIINGKTGWIVVDPLMATETATVASSWSTITSARDRFPRSSMVITTPTISAAFVPQSRREPNRRSTRRNISSPNYRRKA